VIGDGKEMRILLLVKEQYPSSRVRLKELFEKELSTWGSRISWVMQSRDECIEDHVFLSEKNEFHIIGSSCKRGTPGKIFNGFFAGRKLGIATKLAPNCNIIIANDGLLEGIIGLVLKKRYGLPFCFYLSSQFQDFAKENFREQHSISTAIHYFLSIPKRKVFEYVIRNCDLFHPISHTMGHQYVRKGLIKDLFVLPICASRDFLENSPDKLMNGQRNVVVYIGQISRMRRLDFLIRAFSMVKKHSEMHGLMIPKLRIIGTSLDRNEIPSLVQLACALGVDPYVEFIGAVPHDSIPEQMKDVALGVSPIPPTKGYIQSSPTKCIEYLSLGIPVVANREIIDHRDVIEKSNGGIATAYNVEEFSRGIITLLYDQNEADKRGKMGKEWIERNRSYKYLARSLDTKYRELINGSHHEN
jgi:glycosyltransferase involved in cell wall biosynthesis